MSYRAFVVDKNDQGFFAGVRQLQEADLPEGEVSIRVAWSSLNYKDALACQENNAVIRSYPMVPGIDLSGTVEESSDPRFSPGDEVIVTSYNLGVTHPGGYAERARVPAEWVVPLPAGLSLREAMVIGTAGLTAAMSVHYLQQHGVTPDKGPVIVTGATGGVGSTAVDMLAKLGYEVAASTGKDAEHDFLRQLGATEVLPREETSAESARPLEKERWAGAVDPVGGSTTAYLLRTTKYGGSVTLSGLTGGSAINTTTMPFILRGVNLLGVDSVQCPMTLRTELWKRLAGDLKPRHLEAIAGELGLEDLPKAAEEILAGRVRGRLLVKPS